MKPNTYLVLLLFSVLALYGCRQQVVEEPSPLKLRCEYQQNPQGLHTLSPRFSWQLNSQARGAAQSAYQVLVASTPELLARNEGNLWNSGKVNSDSSVLVAYRGNQLQSGQRYFWKVRTWNQADSPSKYSETGQFSMGLLKGFKEWEASWIGNNATGAPPRSIMVRKEFEVQKPVASATVYATGLGNYALYLNGSKTGKDLLTPGWTHYPRRLQYQVYDVTSQLKQGTNALGSILGNMWWSSGLGWNGAAVYSNGPLRFLLSLHILYADSTTEKITTDESWLWKDSPLLENTIYHGVTYDARLEEEGWNSPGFAAKGWQAVTAHPHTGAMLVAQQAPAIQVTEEIRPVSVTETDSGQFVFDFGQNVAGWAELRVQGDSGTTVQLRFAELLDDEGNVAQENLRSARATDTYILSGRGEERFEPLFTYHGFRYVEVTGFPDKPSEDNLVAKVFHSNLPVTGKFASSSELLNSVQKTIVRGLRSNLHSVPTDCPQRDERLGWMGDAQIIAPTASYNMNMALFFSKWMRDITDSQDEEEGFVHDVNPAIVVEGPSKPGWGDAVVVVPWAVWKFYGDTRIIEENYEGMAAWIAWMDRQSKDDIYVWANETGEWFGYSDWIAPEETSGKVVGSAYYFYCNRLMSEMAAAIGRNADADRYAEKARRIKQAFNREYFNEETGSYENGTQTANLLPLAFGLVPEEQKKRVTDYLVKNVEERGKHLSTGFLGTAYLLPILSDAGYHELAWEVATQVTYPSWGYMIQNGATSVWELWDSNQQPPDKMNSRNHFALGSVGEWYFSHLGGLRPDPAKPGFKNTIIAPMPVGSLTSASSSHLSAYGEVASEWALADKTFSLKVKVPANTTARVVLPLKDYESPLVTESGATVFSEGQATGNVKGINAVRLADGALIIETGAGNYEFVVKERPAT